MMHDQVAVVIVRQVAVEHPAEISKLARLYDEILQELEKVDPIKHAEVITALMNDVNKITKPTIAPKPKVVKIKIPKQPKTPRVKKV